MKKKLAILGSTGSIGTQALEVVDNLPDDFKVVALTTNTKIDLLREQIKKYDPEYVVVGDRGKRAELEKGIVGRTQILSSIEELIKKSDVDLILNALSGVAGIVPTLEAVKAGIDVALANKESLVAAGDIIMKLARENKVNIYPVDSEHSAIWQCLRGEKEKEIKKIIITCSGGPFRGKKLAELADITLKQALDHPTWKMGGKITIDSSTLMNKGLEVIEAYQLFDVTPEQIEVVVHPQSIIHSAVEFADGSIKAQLGPHDMRIAIQYALTYPAHKRSPAEDFSLTETARLDFEEPDLKAFPCLAYAFAALEAGGTMPAVVNAANEAAVMLFLDGKIKYLDIPRLIKEAMDKHEVVAEPTFEQIMAASEWAGKIVVG
ncbi:MAG: 1-deoxy-D-xylulose-5-phosphate reductoisomerase [Parcubacteria group bacterium]|nr:1-deoxy-D-xylulose-5-phosphate reductoisomerase [Parcubacteria group bacterium]